MTNSYLQMRQQMKITGEKPGNKKAAVKMNLAQWYAFQLDNAPPKCEMCYKILVSSTLINPKTIVCHIIEKRNFPAVATATENRFYGCSECHDKFDKMSSDEIRELALYPELVRRLGTFYNLITEAEKANLKECFRLDSPGFIYPLIAKNLSE